MNPSVISGLLGGIIAVVLYTYISSKVRDSDDSCELRFGWFMVALGWCCLLFVGFTIYAFFYDNDAWEKPAELYSICGLFIFFGAGAIYSFLEYFTVNGRYDSNGISFSTPWTGAKKEKWNNLKSVNFNSTGNWYLLTFKSGKKIRLSSFLGGHGGVLDILQELGHEI